MSGKDLPRGDSPMPLELPHFPDRLHALVWRNWQLVPLARLGTVIGASESEVLALGKSMGLRPPQAPSPELIRGTRLTVIRRNWHLLPYEQLLKLLDWPSERLARALQDEDFLWIKLGCHKPACEPIVYRKPSDTQAIAAAQIAAWIEGEFASSPDPIPEEEPLLAFLADLSKSPTKSPGSPPRRHEVPQSLCYSYFGMNVDPMEGAVSDPYPDGYLLQLAASGVDAVWLPASLAGFAPFPWDAAVSRHWETRVLHLRDLVSRAARFGLRVYLYLNEPRSMPEAFFANKRDLRGIAEEGFATLCTSHPEVQAWLSAAVTSLCEQVPLLGGFFTITASENLTNCWSHHHGEDCPRCAHRKPSEVYAEVNQLVEAGIKQSGGDQQLIAWDWGWPNEVAEETIRRLSPNTILMSTSEWQLPIQRGGIWSEVGEYCLSAVGPGPRAEHHWEVARECGLRTMAKIQANNTWELSSVPYLPVLENVALHVSRLREAGVGGLMVGWTLGGYPSPNLQVVAEVQAHPDVSLPGILEAVAVRRFGKSAARAVVAAWRAWSEAFQEFPFHVRTVYLAPLQLGPANLLWERDTGYSATMVGFPYDDLGSWTGVFPPEIFEAQLRRVGREFAGICQQLLSTIPEGACSEQELSALQMEVAIAEAAALHFWSVAEQARFIRLRDELCADDLSQHRREAICDDLAHGLSVEITLAKRLSELQRQFSWIGFEASNQYYYVPQDLMEKVVNCHDLLHRWLPKQRHSFGRRGRVAL